MSANPHTSPLAVALFEAFARNGGNRPNDHFDRNAAEQWMQQALDECLPKPAAAQEAVRQPDGYHYRYPDLYGTDTCIRKNNGEEVNGSKPVEAVPYWYAPVTAAPADAEEDAYVIELTTKLLAEIAVIVNGPEPAGTRWSYHDLPAKVKALAITPAAPAVAYMVDGRVERGLTFDKAAAETMALANGGTVRPLVFAGCANAAPADTWFADQLTAMGEVIPLDSTPAAPGIDLTSLVPAEREKPELMMATWHEVAGWNACVAEIRRRIDASPKGALNEQFGSAEGLGGSKGDDVVGG